MRVKVAGPLKARRGQTVRFTASLRKGMKVAFCEVYSAVGDYQPSPFTPIAKLQLVSKEPRMLAATTLRLSILSPIREMELVADEDCKLYFMQEVDVKGDPLVKGKIRINGKLNALRLSALGWYRRIFGR